MTNGSIILITDIGTSSPQQLVCTSDRMPCCQDPPQYGEWYFPDGSQVKHITEGSPTTFHRNRDNNGNVNLYRVNSDVMSPIGSFCCEIEDATVTNQTLCINISKYLNAFNSSVVNSGVYIMMQVTAYTVHSLYSLVVTAFTLPDPNSVTMTSDPVSPIQPVGSDVTLTCTVELTMSPAMDVPVTVNTVWTGPDRFMATNTAQPIMERTTTYTSTAMVSSFGRDQSGVYTCTANVSSTSSLIVGSGSQSGSARVTVGKYCLILRTCTVYRVYAL